MKNVLTYATPDNSVSRRESSSRRLAGIAAAESIVLLENDGLLPISPCSVALYGAGAATTIKGGTGSGEVNERYSVTIEQGLINAGFKITTGKWLRDYEALLETQIIDFKKALVKRVLKSSADDRINALSEGFAYPFGREITETDVAAGGDFCLYVVARQAGEFTDRKLDAFDYNLSPDEIGNIKKAASSYSKTILVINAGSSVDLSPIVGLEGLGAIVYFCQQGMEGGNALADVITGTVSPSGCLTSTWPMRYEDLPNAMEYSYLKGHADFEEYKEGIYVGYRYFDSFGVRPRYEFGYGLSYCDFSMRQTDFKVEGTMATATVNVTNNSDRHSGKKIVQLYVSSPSGKLRKEFQSLASFAKTSVLAPGNSEDIVLSFDLKDFASFDSSEARFILERGDYLIRIGESSAKTEVTAVITLDETAATEVCKSICPLRSELQEIAPPDGASRTTCAVLPDNEPADPDHADPDHADPDYADSNHADSNHADSNHADPDHADPDGVVADPVAADAVRLSISAAHIAAVAHDYEPRAQEDCDEIKQVMGQLTTDDMLRLVTGAGMLDSKPFFKAPGAAAHTTSRLVGKGVPNVALCDGPAGLRLQRLSVRYKNGALKPVDTVLRMHDSIPKIAKVFAYGKAEKGTPLYQYASAFPVGTALAQTWNSELTREVGAAIGAEMAEFGVTFWLAPGMNIQRNPLCGRNFEYYSEDPVLTGKIASSIVRGIQSHEGCYATIKHFAANNQETNRNKSNSIMSERTLREIYLKGFRIAVREGGAKAVMTSYNKLNGVYTPNSCDLCTNVLRREWGFDGLVMTDWFSTGKGLAGNGLAIKAGNDLIMPGGNKFYKLLKLGLEAGIFTEDELRVSASRVLKAVLCSKIAADFGFVR